MVVYAYLTAPSPVTKEISLARLWIFCEIIRNSAKFLRNILEQFTVIQLFDFFYNVQALYGSKMKP